IGTGTPGGTVFRSPTVAEKAWIFVKSGFNMDKAKRNWVKQFKFLKQGDRLTFTSEMLGTYSTKVSPAKPR
ncbi:MAG: hypothetical protein V4692_01760, partial [Bdellovibrionota bacterium]